MFHRARLAIFGLAVTAIFAVAALLVFYPEFAAAQQTTPQARPRSSRPRTTTFGPSIVEQPRFKGIWESVNYGQDLELTDVYFVTRDVGYVSGAGGTILKTTNGGATWTPQLGGDPQSQEPIITGLRFADQRHGWAIQPDRSGELKLLRTSDGETWEQAGLVPHGWGLLEYQFVTPTNGVLLDGNNNASHILHTLDGGRTWKEVFPTDACRMNVQVHDLPQQKSCILLAMRMASQTVGYAVGTLGLEAADVIVVAKTTDGGLSWQLSTAPSPSPVIFPFASGYNVFFSDENNGFLAFSDHLFATNDGGKTWRGLPGSAGPAIRFADPEVGWALQNLRYNTSGWAGLDYGGDNVLHFTTDGGRRWTARAVRFPAGIGGFSLPRRDRAYVAGQHGMIYRYRVVPATYTVAHAIDAPAMPGIDSPVFGEVATMNDVVAKLRTQLPTPAPGGNLAPSQTGGQVGGFQQDTSAPGSGGAGMPPSPTTGAGADGAGGFQQDTGTGPVAGGYMDSCCGPLIQQLETTANSFATNVPAFSQRFRNLNLILEGLNFLNSIVNQANTLKQSIRALRQAKNAQAASAALNTVSTQVNGISSSGGFVQDTSAPPQQ
jgi:photosystem II stability/assembly factor-like uncharacterized protein